MVGSLNDPEGGDHPDNDASNVKPVSGRETRALRDSANRYTVSVVTTDVLARFLRRRK
jgi:hypothetical protein